MPQQPKWHGRLAARLVWFLLYWLGRSWRVRLVDPTGVFSQRLDDPHIFVFWHNRLALSVVTLEQIVKRNNPSARMSALVSASKDGGLLARVIELFGIQPVRGSSSRRGAQALLELTTVMKTGSHAAITPDGPRGPRYVVNAGPAALSQATGAVILPFSSKVGWKVSLRSWDAFQIPLPFSRCDIHFAEPLRVPKEASDAEREALRLELERRLKAITFD